MKLYRITAYVGAAEESTIVQWVGTQTDVKRVLRELIGEQNFAPSNVECDEVEVPTSKAELIAFLNEVYQGV